jgi:hypothetical protein
LVNQKWEEPESNAKPTMWADMRSRMSREIQVRICGGPGGEIPLGYSTVEYGYDDICNFGRLVMLSINI